MYLKTEEALNFVNSEILMKDLLLNCSNWGKCETYMTKYGLRVEIDDNSQQNGSSGTFHFNYKINSKLHEGKNSIVFLGEDKIRGFKAAIKRVQFKNCEHLKTYLTGGIPDEVFVQTQAEKVAFENVSIKIVKLLDWYVYDNYFIIVTEYDDKFDDLYDSANNQDDEHFSEKECKTIFKMLFKTVDILNQNGIFHLDLKPSNIIYNIRDKKLKIIDFGHSTCTYAGQNLLVNYSCGTKGLITPQQVEKTNCFGKDVDLWGVAQTIYFCLQGNYAFDNDLEVLNKKLQFKVKVSEECKDLITRMLVHKVEYRMTPYEIINHPWLKV